MIIRGKGTPGGLMGTCPGSSRRLPYGRAEPAPPRGGQTQRRWPHGGKPGDDAKGDFLGGTRSPRPRCKAVRKPRHNMIIGSKGTPGGLVGTCSGEAHSSQCGRAEPAPPRRKFPEQGLPDGVRSGVAERRFSRRGAACTSGLQGPKDAKGSH
jgi:hypothetical protein